jgi:hypothetical protein
MLHAFTIAVSLFANVPAVQKPAEGASMPDGGDEVAIDFRMRIEGLQRASEVLIELDGRPAPSRLTKKQSKRFASFSRWLESASIRLAQQAQRMHWVSDKARRDAEFHPELRRLIDESTALAQQLIDEARELGTPSRSYKDRFDAAIGAVLPYIARQE